MRSESKPSKPPPSDAELSEDATDGGCRRVTPEVCDGPPASADTTAVAASAAAVTGDEGRAGVAAAGGNVKSTVVWSGASIDAAACFRFVACARRPRCLWAALAAARTVVVGAPVTTLSDGPGSSTEAAAAAEGRFRRDYRRRRRRRGRRRHRRRAWRRQQGSGGRRVRRRRGFCPQLRSRGPRRHRRRTWRRQRGNDGHRVRRGGVFSPHPRQRGPGRPRHKARSRQRGSGGHHTSRRRGCCPPPRRCGRRRLSRRRWHGGRRRHLRRRVTHDHDFVLRRHAPSTRIVGSLAQGGWHAHVAGVCAVGRTLGSNGRVRRRLGRRHLDACRRQLPFGLERPTGRPRRRLAHEWKAECHDDRPLRRCFPQCLHCARDTADCAVVVNAISSCALGRLGSDGAASPRALLLVFVALNQIDRCRTMVSVGGGRRRIRGGRRCRVPLSSVLLSGRPVAARLSGGRRPCRCTYLRGSSPLLQGS